MTQKYKIEYPESTNSLDIATTYPEDMPLCKRLGIATFANLPCHEQLYLGTVIFPETKCVVKVRVHSLPAQFYTFSLWFQGDRGFNQAIIELQTDTGCLRWFWPFVERVAKREVNVVETKRYEAQKSSQHYVHALKVMRWNTTAA